MKKIKLIEGYNPEFTQKCNKLLKQNFYPISDIHYVVGMESDAPIPDSRVYYYQQFTKDKK